jgi:hypothetical protein
MRQTRFQSGPTALEANAASAGMAFACSYSSADEYEAEIIQARRQAGAYGGQYSRAFAVFVLAATVVLVFLAI